MNLYGVSDYLKKQSDFCVSRSKAINDYHDPMFLKYSVLADLYLTLSAAVLVALTPEGWHAHDTKLPDLESCDTQPSPSVSLKDLGKTEQGKANAASWDKVIK